MPSAGHVTVVVTECVCDPPGHDLKVLLPVDGHGDSLLINGQSWKLQRPLQ